MENTSKKTLDDFKEKLRRYEALTEQIRKLTVQEIVTLANAKGIDISVQQLEEAVRLHGNDGAAGAMVAWENYVIIG